MGRKAPGPTPEQQRAEQRKEEELALLEAQEAQRKRALGRRRRGRASLISGAATGIEEGM
jgi:hypothetical protein